MYLSLSLYTYLLFSCFRCSGATRTDDTHPKSELSLKAGAVQNQMFA